MGRKKGPLPAPLENHGPPYGDSTVGPYLYNGLSL